MGTQVAGEYIALFEGRVVNSPELWLGALHQHHFTIQILHHHHHHYLDGATKHK